MRRLKAGEGRTLLLPPFATDLLRRRRPGATPHTSLFPDSLGGWRDPSNTSRDFREARDAAGLSARAVADQLGHAKPSMTQDVYTGRKIVNPHAAAALEAAAVARAAEQTMRFPMGLILVGGPGHTFPGS